MSAFWNSRVRGLSPYVPGEQPGEGKFIKLNTNENPYPPSPKAAAAIRALVSEGPDQRPAGETLRLYPDPLCTAFREAAAAAYQVKPSQVFPGNGSDEVLAFAFGAFFDSQARSGEAPAPPLLFPDISYSFYPVYSGLWDIPFRTVPLAGDFSVDPEAYCVPSGGAVIPNPNAPTGRALGIGDILKIAGALKEQGRVFIVDEAYAAFGAESALPHIGAFPNLLTVHTLSKSASFAGLRAGFAIGSEELIEGLYRIRDSFNSYTLDRLALAGAAAALSDRAYYDGINRRVIATRERTAAALEALGFEVVPSKGNFLFIRLEGRGGAELFRSLRERGILVRHFDKPRISEYLRVSIGSDGDMDAFL
ncbi:MAG: aminotransferase class I/II-fold pyridoxal phosphate-dependent enzyme, partial [Treponema sp.]|nr:aminotransferase class I/II-fold pyridoxal phosphate-dependent enzyme [Treponema sp.]